MPALTLERLPALVPIELLTRLSRPDRPLTTLWIQGGQSITGLIVKVANGTVLVREEEGVRGALTYLPVSALMGVRVHRPETVLDRLSGGVVEDDATLEAPSALALRRHLAARAGIPLNLPWEALVSDAARRSAQKLVYDLDAALDSVGKEYGYSVLAPITTIFLRPSPSPLLERKRNAIRVGFNPEGGAPGRPTRDTLRTGIASVL